MEGLYYEISFFYKNSHVENTSVSGITIDECQSFADRLFSVFGKHEGCFVHLCYRSKRLFTIDARKFLDIVEMVDNELFYESRPIGDLNGSLYKSDQDKAEG